MGDFKHLGDSQGKPRALRTHPVRSVTTVQSLHSPVEDPRMVVESSKDDRRVAGTHVPELQKELDQMLNNVIEDVAQLCSHGQQIWLLGAGASLEANLPLVSGLTQRVRTVLADKPFDEDAHPNSTIVHLIDGLRADIGERATIEDILDHLADHLSIARRSADQCVLMKMVTPDGEPQTERLHFQNCNQCINVYCKPFETRYVGGTSIQKIQKTVEKARPKIRFCKSNIICPLLMSSLKCYELEGNLGRSP